MLVSLLLLTSATSTPIHVGRFDPAEFPNARTVARRMPRADMTRRVENILAKRACRLPGQSGLRFNIDVPYAVLMNSSGQAQKVVVKQMDCPHIETLVGQIALELSKAGDFRPEHGSGERWYVSSVHFAKGGESLARQMDDPEKVVCKAEAPKVGSRLRPQRICRTAAEWQAFEAQRDEFRRDLTFGPGPKGDN